MDTSDRVSTADSIVTPSKYLTLSPLTVAMMFGPSLVSLQGREVAGFLMGFFLQFGIFIGMQIALGVH
jgi:hypothetical protein